MDAQLSDQEYNTLIQAAEAVRASAYAPYSKFHVGAALITEEGALFSGCNVENISYGLTCCAERNAIFTAIGALAGRPLKIKAIAVATMPKSDVSPCGACRQVIAEFGPHARVIYQENGAYKTTSMSQLLPESFNDFPGQPK